MKFQHKQLAFAREYRGYSQSELASKIRGLSQSNLSKFEKGISTLSEELILKTINYLEFPESFLNQKISNMIEVPHYRKRVTISQKIVRDIEASIRFVGYLVDQMADSLEWPELLIEPIDIENGFTPVKIAKRIRSLLDLTPDEPVKDLNTILERNGIIVVEVELTEKFDGVSIQTDAGYPLIILNKHLPNDRKRFSLAHELGHLVMHILGNYLIPEHRENEKENEANQFASEFLMPADAIKNYLWDLRLSDLSELKRYWLTSMAAIIYRAKDLKCIDANRYKYLNIEMSRKGYKREEPVEVYLDSPQLFTLGYRMHKNELSYTDDELAEAFKIPVDIVERFCSSNLRNSKLRVVI